MFLILFLLMSKKQFNELIFNMGCFLILLKLKGQLLEKHTRLQKGKRKQNNQYFNLNVSLELSKKYFALEENCIKNNFKTREKDF